MTKLRGSGWIRFASVLCALSLTLVSFAHRPVQAGKVDPALMAYLAAGGSLSDICGSHDGAPTGGKCPACVIAKILAQVPAALEIVAQVEWVAASPPPQTTFRGTVDPLRRPPTRGPPLTQAA